MKFNKTNFSLKDIVIIILLVLLVLSHIDDNFNILKASDWLSLILELFSICSTIFLGIIAWQQNKKANDINDRLLNIEELNCKTFMILKTNIFTLDETNNNLLIDDKNVFDISQYICIDTFSDINNNEKVFNVKTKCFFKGQFPANEIIVNGYRVLYNNKENERLKTLFKSNDSVKTDIPCCYEGETYDLCIKFRFNDLVVNKIIEKKEEIIIILNINVKNIMNISNNYIIKCCFAPDKEKINNNYLMFTSIE